MSKSYQLVVSACESPSAPQLNRDSSFCELPALLGSVDGCATLAIDLFRNRGVAIPDITGVGLPWLLRGLLRNRWPGIKMVITRLPIIGFCEW